MSANNSARRRRGRPGWEYAVYFAVIFLVSLPLSLVKSIFAPAAATAAPLGGAARFGFVGRAWSEARLVTQMIFSA